MKKFGNLLEKEKTHFDRLNPPGKKLIISVILYSLLAPIFYVFINAYLWRQSQSFQIVAFYNILFFAGILVGFFINGFLFRFYSSPKLYLLGVVLQGISTAVLLVLSNINFEVLIIFGSIFGVATGIFWANRNLLTLKATHTDNRIYFASIESNSDTILKIIVPFLIGWFIIGLHVGDPLKAYRYIAIFMLIITVIIAWQLKNFDLNLVSPSKLFLKSASNRWKKFRVFQFIDGFFDGTMAFIPTLMVLNLVGQEDTLGSIQSISALLAAVVIFVIAKSLKTRHRTTLVMLSVFFLVLGTLFFSFNYSEVGVFVLFAMEAISIPLYWLASSSLGYDLIEEDKNHDLHYAYVVDQEIYLNCGRILGVLIFLFWAFSFSINSAIRFVPLLLGLLQILQIFVVRSLEKKN
jgi:MFS transporter, YQGE family, putative transporter